MLLTYFRVWVFLAGIPGSMEILNSIEHHVAHIFLGFSCRHSRSNGNSELHWRLTGKCPHRVVSSDNDTVVPDSVVVIEMASLALPAWPQQELYCCYKNLCVWKTYSQRPNAYELQLPSKLWCVQFIHRLC
jgi:hypothetical protein